MDNMDIDFTLLPAELWTPAYLTAMPAIMNAATIRNPERVGEVFAAAAAPAAAPVAAAAPLRRPRAADPAKYDGTVDNLHPFLRALANKVELDGELFDTENSKIGYGFSCLEPAAQDRLSVEFAYLDDPTAPRVLQTFADFIAALVRHFDDPGRRLRADRQVVTVRQGNRPFPVFFAEWNQALRHSSHACESSNSRRALLMNALSLELTEQFVATDPPDDYDAFVETCKKLDARIQALAARRRLLQPRGAATPPRATGSATAPPSVATTPAPAPRPTFAPRSTPSTHLTVSQGGDLMDLDAASRERTSDNRLTPRARDARIRLNRCLRCNTPGHIARQCPLGQATVRAVDVFPPAPVEPAAAAEEPPLNG